MRTASDGVRDAVVAVVRRRSRRGGVAGSSAPYGRPTAPPKIPERPNPVGAGRGRSLHFWRVRRRSRRRAGGRGPRFRRPFGGEGLCRGRGRGRAVGGKAGTPRRPAAAAAGPRGNRRAAGPGAGWGGPPPQRGAVRR